MSVCVHNEFLKRKCVRTQSCAFDASFIFDWYEYELMFIVFLCLGNENG